MTEFDPLDDLYENYQKDPEFNYLRSSGTFFVPGDGPMSPNIMLVGEAPGRLENAKRLPFQGRAGINLINILQDLDIDPFTVYMTNVMKYWPRDEHGDTRTPERNELAKHKDYLLQEIDIVKPKIIGLCGFSAIVTLYPKIPSVYHSHAKLLDDKFVPLYHPAGVSWNPPKKQLIVSGYAELVKHLGELSGNSSSSRGAVQ